MKFDNIVGNPPFSKSVGKRKTEPIWDEFVEQAFNLVKPDGYVALIHPSNWRNAGGKFVKTKELLLSKNIQYLNLNDVEEGKRVFGMATTFDWYIIQNNNERGQTKINTTENEDIITDIYNLPFIPNSQFETISALLAKTEEMVDVLYDTKYHHQSDHMNKEKTDIYKYPCVYSIIKDDIPTIQYSSVDRGHFGVPKLIVANGANPKCFIDYTGEYGMTEFAYGIVDSSENLPYIKEAIESEEFQKVNLATKLIATSGNPLAYPRILKTFKKDFWKEFV